MISSKFQLRPLVAERISSLKSTKWALYIRQILLSRNNPSEDDAHNATDGTKMKNIDCAGK
jgi:hypothetical protein